MILAQNIFSDEAKNELMNYNFPGNIRELISIVERAAILSDKEAISKDDLFLYSRKIFLIWYNNKILFLKVYHEKYNIAVVGATGAVGEEIFNALEEVPPY